MFTNAQESQTCRGNAGYSLLPNPNKAETGLAKLCHFPQEIIYKRLKTDRQKNERSINMRHTTGKWNERIRMLRKQSKYTQKEVAGLLKISQRTYCDYEAGRLRIPLDRLIFLARHYDCCMDYISGAGNVHKSFPQF